MSELPTGTVTLLFSDVEGSTVLLSRLGAAYADALDGQRLVLRKAWAEHGGVELGTEGDSFYVVFPTAPAAVTAAVQAQRELAVFEWPAGERVRVRMGIHTGNPTVHDGAYVGMDVHRAARIAGAAHGGQVVVSSSTAELVGGCLPDGVELRDLGSHQLKDIPQPERLFQLAIRGLQVEFPPIKTLGAASSLPRPATPLVGRDGALAELTALMGSPDVRLVTLTGPGGTGKTRLAIALAQGLRERFPDGVYFIPLAAVTTFDVMWTSIAEVLDVPPEGRIPPGFFDHVAHRTALFVLDNLEQIDAADTVVAELLDHAPQVVAVATSRRPLAVPAEHVHPVPPLELPEGTDLEQAQESGAVQLFVQHARRAKPAFQLTTDNAHDVAEICRHLDGLPLAIELSAARARVLSPAALLSRLDKALDIAASGHQAPSRQKTLRDTIAWSYDLLNPTQQAFFRRLGVFAGSADLDAITAVTADILDDADPFDLAVDLVDASLAVITDDEAGEPRIGMLETIRAYALDQLRQAGEIEVASLAHAQHYVVLADRLRSMQEGAYVQARSVGETELDNFREALAWSLQPQRGGEASDRVSKGLQLCADLGSLWSTGGYLVEGRRWCEQAIEVADGSPSTEPARCLLALASLLVLQGQPPLGRDLATRSLAMFRTLGDPRGVVRALETLGVAEQDVGDFDAARKSLEEALVIARESGRGRLEAGILANLGGLEVIQRNYERGEELLREALVIYQERGDVYSVALNKQNLAYTLGVSGRAEEAHLQVRDVVQDVLALGDPGLTIDFADTYMDILIRLGDPEPAAQLLGATDAMRERNAIPRLHQQEEVQEVLDMARPLISAEDWDRHYQLGRGETVENVVRELSTN